MCQSLKNSATSSMSRSGIPTSSATLLHGVRGASGQITQSKSTFRLSPFRKVAKSARINLNRYWGLLSTKLQSNKSSTLSEDIASISYDEAVEQNRINQLLEAQALATSQNSLNSQMEEDYFNYYSNTSGPILWQHSPSDSPAPVRCFVRQPQRSLGSDRSSCISPASQQYFSFDDSASQDSVFL